MRTATNTRAAMCYPSTGYVYHCSRPRLYELLSYARHDARVNDQAWNAHVARCYTGGELEEGGKYYRRAWMWTGDAPKGGAAAANISPRGGAAVRELGLQLLFLS